MSKSLTWPGKTEGHLYKYQAGIYLHKVADNVVENLANSWLLAAIFAWFSTTLSTYLLSLD